jgi:hypothetical protein
VEQRFPLVSIDTDDDLTRSGLTRIAARAGLAVAPPTQRAPVVLRASSTTSAAPSCGGNDGGFGGGAEIVVTDQWLTVRLDIGAENAVVQAVCQLLATVWT